MTDPRDAADTDLHQLTVNPQRSESLPLLGEDGQRLLANPLGRLQRHHQASPTTAARSAPTIVCVTLISTHRAPLSGPTLDWGLSKASAGSMLATERPHPGGKMAQQEVRLALVMNGGVSLAVWMGGVVDELCRLLRPSTAVEDVVTTRDFWAKLLEGTGTRVIVDIIAGTSAGGLNGTLLAAALGTGAPMPDTQRLWREAASLDSLLRPGSGSASNSLLNGDFLKSIVSDQVLGLLAQRDLPRAEPVTLFVTATALESAMLRTEDSFGGGFTYVDSRRRFEFRSGRRLEMSDADLVPEVARGDLGIVFPENDDGPRSDITDQQAVTIVEAARASASYPMAFEPARVEQNPTWLIDGGVLDNAPFTPVMDEIASRRVDGPVRRVVVYVHPSPGGHGRGTAGHEPTVASDGDQNSPSPPGPLGPLAVAWRALRLPSEVDLRSDVEELSDAMTKAREDEEVRLTLANALRAAPAGPLVDAAQTLFPTYRDRRTRGGVRDMRLALAKLKNAGAIIRPFVPANDVPAAGGVPSWVPACSGADVGDWGFSTSRAILCAMLLDARSGGHAGLPRWDSAAADITTGMARIDALYRRFEAAFGTLAKAAHLDAWTAAADEVLQISNAGAEAVLAPALLGRIMRAAADSYATALASVDADAVGSAGADAAGADAEGIAVVDANGDVDDDAAETAENRVGQLAEAILRSHLLAEVLVRGAQPPSDEARTPPFELLHLGPDIVGPDPGPAKGLYGEQLGHFGAFVRSSWREADWTWGRLHAAQHLIRLLLSQERLAEALAQPASTLVPALGELLQTDITTTAALVQYASTSSAGQAVLLERLTKRAHSMIVEEAEASVRAAVDTSVNEPETVSDVLRAADGKALARCVAGNLLDVAAGSQNKRMSALGRYAVIAVGSREQELGKRDRTIRWAFSPLRSALWTGLGQEPLSLAARLKSSVRPTLRKLLPFYVGVDAILSAKEMPGNVVTSARAVAGRGMNGLRAVGRGLRRLLPGN